MQTLGYDINVGWTNLAGGMEATAKGDEILEPLFEKSGTGPVTWKPLSHYAPPDTVSFGWYTGDGGTTERTTIGTMNGVVGGGYQSLLPPMGSGNARRSTRVRRSSACTTTRRTSTATGTPRTA